MLLNSHAQMNGILGATLEDQDTSIIRTPLVVPKVSALHRFYCAKNHTITSDLCIVITCFFTLRVSEYGGSSLYCRTAYWYVRSYLVRFKVHLKGIQ